MTAMTPRWTNNAAKLRIGGRWTRAQLAELLLVGPMLWDEVKDTAALLWFEGEIDPTTHDKTLGETALDLVAAHPEHLLVLMSCEPVELWPNPKFHPVERAIKVLEKVNQPFTCWRDLGDRYELKAYPGGLRCQTDSRGLPMIAGDQLRLLRQALKEGNAGRALSLLNGDVPEIPKLPPLELVE